MILSLKLLVTEASMSRLHQTYTWDRKAQAVWMAVPRTYRVLRNNMNCYYYINTNLNIATGLFDFQVGNEDKILSHSDIWWGLAWGRAVINIVCKYFWFCPILSTWKTLDFLTPCGWEAMSVILAPELKVEMMPVTSGPNLSRTLCFLWRDDRH